MTIDISNMTIQIGHNAKSWIDILSALLAPAVATLTILIAYLQWRTNERKRKQDLFEMRYDNLYFPIYTCIKNIQEMKCIDVSLEEKGKRIQDEIQKFWIKFCKYKFLITNEDSEKLSQHHNYILDIIQKYDYQNKNSEVNAEEILSIIALIYHLMQMEEILTKYLRIEPDTRLYKVKCWFSSQKNKLIPNKQTSNTAPVAENKTNNEGCFDE